MELQWVTHLPLLGAQKRRRVSRKLFLVLLPFLESSLRLETFILFDLGNFKLSLIVSVKVTHDVFGHN